MIQCLVNLNSFCYGTVDLHFSESKALISYSEICE